MLRHANRVHFFLQIWAATSLVHRLAFSSWIDSTLGWIATAGSLLLLVAPRSSAMLVIFLVANSIYLFDILPNVANHLLFEAILNPTLLLAFAASCWHARSLRADPARFLSKFLPVVRAQLIGLYFFAVVHKLNWDFLDPSVSCGSKMFQETLDLWLPWLTVPTWTEIPVIMGTLLCEAGILLLLVFRNTRHMGIATGLVFHGLLALHPHIGVYSFSAMLFGLYALFLSDSAIEVLRGAVENAATRICVIAVFVGTSAWQQIATRGLNPYPARLGESEIGFYACAIFGLALGAGYGFAMWRSRKATEDRTSEAAHPPGGPGLLWLMVIPVLISGISPYIGLKTQGSFSMFSNLRTEGTSNHLFLGRIDLFPYQSDLVSVTASSHAGFSRWAARQQQMTYFQFREVASSIQGDLRIDFIRNGQKHSVRKRDAEGEDAEIFERHSWWLRKFLAFRRLPDPDQAMPCRS